MLATREMLKLPGESAALAYFPLCEIVNQMGLRVGTNDPPITLWHGRPVNHPHAETLPGKSITPWRFPGEPARSAGFLALSVGFLDFHADFAGLACRFYCTYRATLVCFSNYKCSASVH